MGKVNKNSQQKPSGSSMFKTLRSNNKKTNPNNKDKFKSKVKNLPRAAKGPHSDQRNKKFSKFNAKDQKESTSQQTEPKSKPYLSKKNEIAGVKEAELAAAAEAKSARIKNQKAKRLERTIVVSKKTKKGQPLMRDRINFLLKKIEGSRS